MARPPDLFTIAVAGAMNPQIHHPSWYRLTEIVSEQEIKTALESELMCAPFLAHFRLGDFFFQCQTGKWEIQATNVDACDRMLEIAEKTFGILEHTPVTAFGFNFHLRRETKLPNVGKRFAEGFTLIPFDAGEAQVSVQYTVRMRAEDRTIQRIIAGLDDEPAFLAVLTNVNYVIQASGKFDLGSRMRSHFHRDLEEALQHFEGLVIKVNQLAEG